MLIVDIILVPRWYRLKFFSLLNKGTGRNMTRNSVTVLFLLVFCQPVLADNKTVVIKEWKVPWENTRPRDPYIAPDGRPWFCGQGGGYLARFDPETEEFKKYDLGEGAGPHNLIIDAMGRIWYAGNRRAHIGRLDPDTGQVKKYSMPDADVTDPHTLVFDHNGDIWFTAQISNHVGKLTVATGEIQLIEVPTSQARPYGISIDSTGRPWIALFGTNKLAMIDPDSFRLTEYELPREKARPRRLSITSDDNIWYVDYAGGVLGQFDPGKEVFIERQLPGGQDARPYGMTVDDKDRLWLVETGEMPNRFVGYDPRQQQFITVTEINSGAGAVRHMYFDQDKGAIWFGTDTNFLGRAIVP